MLGILASSVYNGIVQPTVINSNTNLASLGFGAWEFGDMSPNGQVIVLNKQNTASARLSLNGGISFTTITHGITYLTDISVSSTGQYIVVGSDNSGYCKISRDYGVTWSNLVVGDSTFQYSRAGIKVSDDGNIVIGGRYIGGVWITKNSGTTFTILPYTTTVTNPNIQMSSDGRIILLPHHATIPKVSQDFGGTWKPMNNSPLFSGNSIYCYSMSEIGIFCVINPDDLTKFGVCSDLTNLNVYNSPIDPLSYTSVTSTGVYISGDSSRLFLYVNDYYAWLSMDLGISFSRLAALDGKLGVWGNTRISYNGKKILSWAYNGYVTLTTLS